MNKKVIFLDIDGTLITNTDKINQQVISKVKKLRENGWIIALATGRTVGQAKSVIDDLAIRDGVFANGQTIMREGEIVSQHTFTPEDTAKIFAIAKQNKLHSGYVTPAGIYLERGLKGSIIKYKLRKFPFGGIKLRKLTTQDVQGFWFFANAENINTFHQQVKTDYKVFQYGDKSIEVLPMGFDKHRGAVKFMETFNTKPYTVTIGDGKNDLEIFDYVDYPIAMGNAINELKDKAAFITKSNVENGVAYAVDHLIEKGH